MKYREYLVISNGKVIDSTTCCSENNKEWAELCAKSASVAVRNLLEQLYDNGLISMETRKLYNTSVEVKEME